jgi:hypothetical protein
MAEVSMRAARSGNPNPHLLAMSCGSIVPSPAAGAGADPA